MTAQHELLILVFMPMLSSVLSYWIGTSSERYRNIFLMLMVSVEALIAIDIYTIVKTGEIIYVSFPGVMGVGFDLKCDLYRFVYIAIAVFAWFVTTMYSFLYLIKYNHRNRYFMFFTLTLSATVGFFLSANIIIMFTFFEVLSIALYLLIIHDEDEYSHEAGSIYLNMAIFGGLVQLLGIFMLYAYTGTITIDRIGMALADLGRIKYVIALLIFTGYAVKASCFPLHVWLPKAHPAAPSPASAVLSGVMLKCGVFGIIMVANDFLNLDQYFATLLMIIAYANMILTGTLAMYQRNLKRIMAFSSMSQIGFILLGVALLGVDENYAAYGTLLYIINHSVYKVLLFLCAGVIYTVVKDLSLNHLKGFGRQKYILFLLFLSGVLGLTAFPGFNGYLGKTLLYHALEHYVEIQGHSFQFLLWLFDLGSMITVAYSLKMLVAIFIWKSDAPPPQTRNLWIYFPLSLLAIAIFYEGTHPSQILALLNDAALHLGGSSQFHYDFYEVANLMHSAVIFAFGILIYVFFINGLLRRNENGRWVYVNPSMTWVSAETLLYQPGMTFVLKVVPRTIMKLEAKLTLFVATSVTALLMGSDRKFKTTSCEEFTLRSLSISAFKWLNTVSGSMILALLATMIIYMVLTLV